MEPDNEEMANFRTWAVGTGKYSLTTSVRMTRTVRSLYRKLDLDNPSTEALWAYVERQLKKGRRDGTINNQMKDIAAWFRFKGIKLQVPSLRQRRSKEPWVPKDDEVFRLIRVCEEGKNRITALRNKTIIEIMAFCGLRLGEVVQLNISDVQNEYLHVRSEKLEAERKVGLPDFVRSDIMTYLKQR
ncbi:MAG: site-specific integrase, partial [Thermoplasmata archaeon]|nr:site-specific integrase [Candidatus Sysuiplasma acidicola]